jgi:hypothetical protein
MPLPPHQAYGNLLFRTHFDEPNFKSINDPILGSSTMLHTTPDVLNITLATGCNFWLGSITIAPDDPYLGGSVILQGFDYMNELAWEVVQPVVATGPTEIDMIYGAKPSVFSVTAKVVITEPGKRRLLGFVVDNLVVSADVKSV